MIGKQHFYLQDLFKADYYMDRCTRGKFELPTSKIRELSLIQMQRKIDSRKVKTTMGDTGEPQPDNYKEMDLPKVMAVIDKSIYKVKKIQKRSKNGFYKIVSLEHEEMKSLTAGLYDRAETQQPSEESPKRKVIKTF